MFPVGRIRKMYVMASESVRWQWIRRDCTESSPRSTLDFRSRISGLETNPFTLYWSRPCGLWPNEFPPSPPSTRRHSIITLSASPGTRKRCLFLIIPWNIGPRAAYRSVKARHELRSVVDWSKGVAFINNSNGYPSVTRSRSFAARNEYLSFLKIENEIQLYIIVNLLWIKRKKNI